MQQAQAIDGGFADPVLDGQGVFRAVMDAMARPGRTVAMPAVAAPPSPLSATAGAIACTLADADTPVWLDAALVRSAAVTSWLAFHTGAPVTGQVGEAALAFIADPVSMPALEHFAQGTQDYPDRSATLILQLASLEGGAPLSFAGPGIEGAAQIAPQSLPPHFAAQWSANRERFPRGVDIILAGASAVICLPRSARLLTGRG